VVAASAFITIGVGLGWQEATAGAFCARANTDAHRTKPSDIAALSKRERLSVFNIFKVFIETEAGRVSEDFSRRFQSVDDFGFNCRLTSVLVE
jgi:hypothetical protein